MQYVKKLAEHGYEEAALGFSLSFNTSIERAKELLPKYAWGKVAGENKFLRVIRVWLDINFPRLILPEMDQYKVGTTSLSESTVHTLSKRYATPYDFDEDTDIRAIAILNEKIDLYRNKEISLKALKANLPEGFLQRRIYEMSYANLQNIINQRVKHKVDIWDDFIEQLVCQVDHPEFIIRKAE